MAVSVKQRIASKKATTMVVDHLISLKKKIDALKPTIDEYNENIAKLREKAMKSNPDDIVVFEGTNYNILFGKASHDRKLVDVEGAKKALGNDVFFQIAKVTLGDLDAYLTPEELQPLIEEERGSRKLEVVER